MLSWIVPKQITKLYAVGGILSNAMYVAIFVLVMQVPLAIFVTGINPPNLVRWYVILLSVVCVLLARRWYIEKNYIAARKDYFDQLAAQTGYSKMTDVERLQAFGKTALNTLEASRALEWNNTVKTKDWAYCDYRYEIHRHLKSGSYKSADIYYGVMSAPLNRQVPHAFFDSIKARKRQFKFVFARAQQHSLEGAFDQHFVTYFPKGYTIDNMSFISPEVMWEIQQADEYDVEIAQDRLYIYGPLYDPEQQLADMSKALLSIRKKLIDNIDTYRDERLPMHKGRSSVAISGVSLVRSRLLRIIGSIVGFLYVIILLLFQLLAS